jgi:pectate lyase
VGVVARAGQQGYYVLRLLPQASNGPRAQLARYDAASTSFVTLAEAEHAGFATEQWVRLELRVAGGQLVGLVDGQQVLSATDATLASGRAGVYGYAQGGLVFDNLAVLPGGN